MTNVFPECLLTVYNKCLKEGVFIKDWKNKKLILLRKGNKPINQTSSFRPLCLLDTMGKLLEGLLLTRLESHVSAGLSGNQYGFRKGLSTTDAILEVVNLAKSAKTGTGKNKGYCALVTIDIRNAFNSVRWKDVIEALQERQVPEYLLRMIEDYLSERTIIYENFFRVEEDMTCGVPQGSRLGPFLWNVMFDGLLRLDLPEDSRLIGYADDTLIVCHSDSVPLLEMKVNETLFRVKRWLDRKHLEMALEKTEAVLVTDKRAFKYPCIYLGDNQIIWKKQITYLGVEIDQRLCFGPHIRKMADKAAETAANIARMMPNLGGPKEAKRRLIASVAHSKMLYAAPVWAEKLEIESTRKMYSQIQRRLALRIGSMYRTVSYSAALVIGNVPPIDLLAVERKEVYERKQQGRVTSLSEVKIIKEDARKTLLRKWQRRWDEDTVGRWTYKLIPNLEVWVNRTHGQVSFYLSQALSGHGLFNKYLHDYKIVNSPNCSYCLHETDTPMHTLFECTVWEPQRKIANDLLQQDVKLSNMIPLMLTSHENWTTIETMVTNILKTKKKNEY